jgi:hypothetical protein
LERAYWVGWDGSKSGKDVCTTLHIPEHAYTSQHNSGTSRHKREHASTFLHDRGTAFADAQAILRTALTSPDTLLFPFRGGRQAGLDECRQGIEVKRLPHGASLPRRPALREKNQPPAEISTEHYSPLIFAEYFPDRGTSKISEG